MAAKVLLVEDDNNLREIYEARLLAEGYTILTAKDGEEALVVAKAETPDLIISDVMMPRISGFEMLDILRNTENLKDTKVIMLTALGQADDKTRANSLGADRYLVKSQVTLEDIVKAAHELVEGAAPAAPTTTPTATDTPAAAAPAPQPTPLTATPPVVPIAPPMPSPMTSPTVAVPAAPVTPVVPEPAAPVAAPVTPVFPPVATPAAPVMPPAAAPAAEPTPMAAPTDTPAAALPAPQPTDATPLTASQEQATVSSQIDNFVRTAPESQPEVNPTTTQDDAVLADAVHELANTAEEKPAAPADATPAPTVVAPTEPVQPAPAQADTEHGSVPIANKKIIQPLPADEAKPDIQALLAREEANNAAGAASFPTTAPSYTPGSAVTPQSAPQSAQPTYDASQPLVPPVQQPPVAQPGEDPNNIAL